MSPLSQYKSVQKIEMFYDGAYSRIVRYGHVNVCGSARIHKRWEEICRKESGSVEKRDHSLTLHFCEPHHMGSSYRIRKVVCFIIDCKSPWIVMESREDPIQYDETLDYNSRD